MRSNPFTEARPYLWSGEQIGGLKVKERYLCHALMRAHEDGHLDAETYGNAKVMIYTRLGDDYPSVESFLTCEARLPLALLTHENVQAYRFLWLAELEQLWNQGKTK